MNTHDTREHTAAQLILTRAEAYASEIATPGDEQAQAVGILLAAIALATKDLSTERRKALILETME
jgi:hypothetical protein